MSLHLARLEGSEAEAVFTMAGDIWPSAYGKILSPGQIDYMLARMYHPGQIRRELAEGVDYRWIGCGERRLGFLAFGPAQAGEACPLHKFYLLPEEQGSGKGRAALALLIELAARSGATSLELRVNRHNTQAIAFYQRNGFSTYAEDLHEIGGGFAMDDFLMRRNLEEGRDGG